MRRFPLLITALFAAALFNGAVGLAEDTTYAPWQGQTQNADMQQLLKQLRALTAKGERDCFIAASLTVKPDYHWTVNGEDFS